MMLTLSMMLTLVNYTLCSEKQTTCTTSQIGLCIVIS